VRLAGTTALMFSLSCKRINSLAKLYSKYQLPAPTTKLSWTSDALSYVKIAIRSSTNKIKVPKSKPPIALFESGILRDTVERPHELPMEISVAMTQTIKTFPRGTSVEYVITPGGIAPRTRMVSQEIPALV
jgi:hypothetical protein